MVVVEELEVGQIHALEDLVQVLVVLEALCLEQDNEEDSLIQEKI
jgi:hypothetical protein